MKSNVLIVDDDANLLSSLQRKLRSSFEVVTAQSGAEGITALKEKALFSAVITDYRMPETDGIQFLAEARKVAPDTVRIMLTGQADLQVAIDAVNKGNLFRFLTKPCSKENLILALNAAVEQNRLIKAEHDLLHKTLKGSIKVLTDVLSMASPLAFSRSSRIRDIAKRLAVRLNLKNSWELELAAGLSQIGCITIPTDTLRRKYQGKTLDEDEKEMFQVHPQIGHDLLVNIPRMEEIAEGIAYQDRQFHGEGSSNEAVWGTDIPLIARILKVILDFDLRVEGGNTDVQALKELLKSHKRYDPDILAALEAEVIGAEEGFVVIEIEGKDIDIGMVLADDIKTKEGLLLVPKRYEVSAVMRARLMNYSRTGMIEEPIRVLNWIKKEEN